MSTAPGTCSTSACTCRPCALSDARSSPRTSSWSCFRPPPMSLVKTASLTPATLRISLADDAGDSSAESFRSCLGVIFT